MSLWLACTLTDVVGLGGSESDGDRREDEATSLLVRWSPTRRSARGRVLLPPLRRSWSRLILADIDECKQCLLKKIEGRYCRWSCGANASQGSQPYWKHSCTDHYCSTKSPDCASYSNLLVNLSMGRRMGKNWLRSCHDNQQWYVWSIIGQGLSRVRHSGLGKQSRRSLMKTIQS